MKYLLSLLVALVLVKAVLEIFFYRLNRDPGVHTEGERYILPALVNGGLGPVIALVASVICVVYAFGG